MKNLKQLLVLFALCLSTCAAFAQSVTIGEKEFNAHPSAILDIQSSAKGVLIPRLNFVQRANMPADSLSVGLLIYQTDSIPGFYYFDGQEWKVLSNLNENGTVPNLAKVAKTGDYNDLENKPDLFSGKYADLTGIPEVFDSNYFTLRNLPNIKDSIDRHGFDGNYENLTHKPNLFSGKYADLTGIPEVFDSNYFALKNVPKYEDSVVKYLATHDLNSASHKDIRDSLEQLQTEILLELSVKSNVLHVHDYFDLKNKPDLFSGKYADLTNIPEVFDSNYRALKNTPNIKDTVAKYGFDGNYNTLTSKPSIKDTVEKYRNVPPFAITATTLSTNPGETGNENTIARGDHTHTVTPAEIGAAAKKHTHTDMADLTVLGNLMFFAHQQSGTGDGSNWTNAKKFTPETYNAMPENTSALLLGDGNKKYVLKNKLIIQENKPVFGGFIGNGLLRQNSEITIPNAEWQDVKFSKYATVFEGFGSDEQPIIAVYNSCVDGIILGNCRIEGYDNSALTAFASTITNCTVSNVYQSKKSYAIGLKDSSTALNCSVMDSESAGFIMEKSVAKNCTVDNCSPTTYYGSGMTLYKSLATGCHVNNCHNSEGYGGIAIDHADIYECTVRNCTAWSGGGIGIIDSSTAVGCIVDNCRTTGEGGGIYLSGGAVVKNCVVTNCHSISMGGGIYVDLRSIVIQCSFVACSANVGAGIYAWRRPTIENCTVRDCMANRHGAIYSDGASIKNTTVSGCTAGYSDPGIGGYVADSIGNKCWNNTLIITDK